MPNRNAEYPAITAATTATELAAIVYVQALEQAKLVATHQADKLDWGELDAWVIAEGIGDASLVIDFYGEIRGASPPR